MTKIEAFIKPFKLDDVKASLAPLGVHGITATEVRGFGRQTGSTARYRGTQHTAQFVPKLKLEVVVAYENAERVVRAIEAAARTGDIGDGKIVVIAIGDAVRIRTGEHGERAV